MTDSLLMTDDRRILAGRLGVARGWTDELFGLLTPEALYSRPIPERHRLVFYLGHVEAFDWNLIARQSHGVEPFRAEFDKLFAFGIDPVDGGLPNEPASDWPRREDIDAYNARVREIVDECVSGARSIAPGFDAATIFNMAIEHRLMHAETLAYLLHHVPFDGKRAPASYAPAPQTGSAGRDTAAIPAGTATLGRDRRRGFGWDNEFDAHTVAVPGFTIGANKVTNAQFLEFVADRGYGNRALWSESDWNWKEREERTHPGFWTPRGSGWEFRGMFGALPLPLDAPVYVSQAEASAYARWAGGKLPTEEQFHRAAYGTLADGEREYPWGDAAPEARHGNFDFRHWEPSAVGAFPAGDSAFGVSELVGNGWEWTRTAFAPFDGFEPHPLYAGYSANFFDGDHFVLKGGSPRTAACFLRRSFRNWFQPHYPYLYATFRLVTA